MAVISKNRIIGILANVDSGKTTLAEAMLYHAGAIRQIGRVDHRSSYLDTAGMERARGITIYSKIARLNLNDVQIILLDTPGHADFTPETERTLPVLDYCILVINGADGVTAQTRRLWDLLGLYQVPVLLFVNKTDQAVVDPRQVYEELRRDLSEQILDFTVPDLLQSEELAILSEPLLEAFLKSGSVDPQAVRQSIRQRQIYPCYFGSALKDHGVEDFLKGLVHWTLTPEYPEDFSARVYKITREENQRLTFLKITGGTLKNKSLIGDEKINEIRLYSGDGFAGVQSAAAGEICGVTGLKETRVGQILGDGVEQEPAVFPILSYRVHLLEGGDEAKLIRLLLEISEELPDLGVALDRETSSVHVHVMGDMLLEVLQDLLERRGGMKISLDEGSIVYRETITAAVTGIGHYEPLGHYAEVQLRIEPAAAPGVIFSSECSISDLPPLRQQQILREMRGMEVPGVLAGTELSHLKVTLINGREHERHSQSSDFREASARALRQGLMQARKMGACRLLEPYYDFEILTDQAAVGRMIADLDRLGGEKIQALPGNEEMVITGCGPVRTLRSYQREMLSAARGHANLRFEFGGYRPCQDEAKILQTMVYDPEKDPAFPSGSIFCSHGAGYYVPWDEVEIAADIPVTKTGAARPHEGQHPAAHTGSAIDPKEIDRILQQTFYANANEKKQWRRQRARKAEQPAKTEGKIPGQTGPVYLLVDGYNVIHAWPELAELARINFDAAREKLIEVFHDYQGYTEEQVILVFDAWKVVGGTGSREEQDRLTVVFTRENETADRYIERRVRELAGNHPVKVVTSDLAEQMQTYGSGAMVYSARRFREIIAEIATQIWQDYARKADPMIPNRPLADPLRPRLIDGDEPGIPQQLIPSAGISADRLKAESEPGSGKGQ